MEKPADRVLQKLEELEIPYRIYEHPPLPTIGDAEKYWQNIDATHCKNIFFRNHKGNRHYLVVLEHRAILDIHDLEKRLRQGKLTFASPKRMKKYLGLEPGSVSPFGLINDTGNHVHLFLDEQLQKADKISFHPNINTATVVIPFTGFISFLENSGNSFEFLRLYD